MKIVIFVGPTRTSTTSIYRSLLGCSGIIPSKVKETNFLLERDLQCSDNALKDYLSIFELGGSSDIYFEASPLYFMRPDLVVPNLNKLVEFGVELVVVFTLRDPVDRFYSIYNHIVTKRSIGKFESFDEFLRLNIENFSMNNVVDDVDNFSLYESDYAKLLKAWSVVDESVQKYVVFSEVIAGDGNFNAVVREVFSSSTVLNSEGTFTLLLENQAKDVKYPIIHKLSLKLNDDLEFFLNKFPLVRRFLKRVYYYLNGDESKAEREFEFEVDEILTVANAELPRVLEGYRVIGSYPDWLSKLTKYE